MASPDIGAPAADPVQACVLRLQNGDTSALEPLIEATQARAWHLAYSILQNRQEVEDALQDCYLTVFQSISQLRQPEAFWGWFKRIVVHRCWRLQRRPALELIEEWEAEDTPEVLPEERLDLQQAFQKLSLTDRTVLGLREILDMPYEQIAQLLEVPLNTVRTRLHHARQRFSRLFTGGAK